MLLRRSKNSIKNSRYWKKRKLNDKNRDWETNTAKNWIDEYWKSRNHPHRQVILNTLTDLFPFDSLLEVGCNCGPNLSLIQKRFPSVKLVGVDINRKAILEAHKRLSNVVLHRWRADKLAFSNKIFDILLTDALLIYIEPREIRKVIEEFIRVTKKAMVFCEWNTFGSKLGEKIYDHWSRDYVKLLNDYNIDVQLLKLTEKDWPGEKWSRVGYIIKAVL